MKHVLTYIVTMEIDDAVKPGIDAAMGRAVNMVATQYGGPSAEAQAELVEHETDDPPRPEFICG